MFVFSTRCNLSNTEVGVCALQAAACTLPLLPSPSLPPHLPPQGHLGRAVIAGSMEARGLRVPRELRNFKTTEAGDLESTRFYYLFIKKSVTDNSARGYKRCSLPTQPEKRTWGWAGEGVEKRTQPAGNPGLWG